jgi:HEAT repeat protein
MLSFFRKLFGISERHSTPVHPILRRMLNGNSQLEKLDSVIAKLGSDSVDDRRNAAYALGDYDDPIVTDKLLSLIHNADKYVQIYSIQSLGRRRAAAAVTALCELLATHNSHALVVSNALRVLADLQDYRALDTLVGLLKSEAPFTRYDAAFALGEIGHPDAIPHLELLLSDDTIPEDFDDDGGRTTAWSVCENAKKAVAKIRASKTA